jgi:hypothetical protein
MHGRACQPIRLGSHFCGGAVGLPTSERCAACTECWCGGRDAERVGCPSVALLWPCSGQVVASSAAGVFAMDVVQAGPSTVLLTKLSLSLQGRHGRPSACTAAACLRIQFSWVHLLVTEWLPAWPGDRAALSAEYGRVALLYSTP